MSRQDRPLGASRSQIHVVLVSRDEAYASDLIEFLGDYPSGITVDYVLSELPETAVHRGTVVLVDERVAPQPLNAAASALLSIGASRVFLLVNEPRAPEQGPPGVEVLFKYAMGSSLVERIRSVPISDEAPTPQVALRSADRPVVAFYSPRGGAGCSTLAANLAYIYAASGKRVVLVDLARFGSQHVILRQPQRGHGLSSLITLLGQQSGSVSTERMAGYLQQAIHRVALGQVTFDLLPAAQPVRMDQTGAEQAKAILELLRSAGYELILVDLSQEMSDRIRGALGVADRILIPVLPELVSVWHALQVRDQLGVGVGARPAFVINRMQRRLGFDPVEFVRLGGTPLLASVPDETRDLQADLAVGSLTARRRRSPFTRALQHLAHTIYPALDSAEMSGGRWLWSRR